MKTPDTAVPKEYRVFPLIILICGILTAGFGAAALFGWAAGLPVLTTFGSGLIPMAPSTALLFLLYGVETVLIYRLSLNKTIYRMSMIIASAGVLISLILFILSSMGIHPEAEHLGLRIAGEVDGAPIGHISPLTAFCFLLAGLSSIALLLSSPSRLWRTNAAFGFAFLIIMISFVLIMAYFLGLPLLYGSGLIPPALSTSIAFVILGTTLLVSAVQRARQYEKSYDISASSYVFVMIFVLMAAGIITTGYLYYRNYEKSHRAVVERQLSTVTDLKVDELKQWRKERVSDAAFFYRNFNFSGLVLRYFGTPGDLDAEKRLRTWLKQIREAHQYDRVCLHDAEGRVRMSVPGKTEPMAEIFSLSSSEALRSGQIAIEDFYWNEHKQHVYLNVLVPVITDGEHGGRAIGVLSMRIDPEQYLYPLINNWPVPSATAETFIVRRDGNEALFLNELRFKKGTALNLRISLDRKDLPAVQAALGRQGIMDGRDYRGVPVIAALRAVPDSPWFLVARMDVSEVYAPVKERRWLVLVLVGALLISAAGGIGLVWRQQSIIFYREKGEVSESLRESEEKYRTLVENIPQKIFTKDRNSAYVSCNENLARDLGITPAEFAGKTDYDFFPQELADKYRSDDRRIMESGETEGIEEQYIRNGEKAWIYTVKTPIRDKEGNIVGILGIFSDITERKQAEAELRESEKRLREVQEMAHLGHWQWDVKTGDVEWSEEVYKIFQLDPDKFTPRIDSILALSPWPEDHERDKELIRKAMESHEKGDYEQRFLRPDKSIGYYYSTFQGRYDEEGSLVSIVGSVMDITEYRKLEEQLRQSQKMEAIGTLAGGVAHDFNNILSAIIGYGHMALMKMAEDDPQRLNIESMLEAADRAAYLTKDLLLFSRKQISEQKAVDLNEIVRKVEKFLRRVIGEDIEFKTIITETPLTVFADSHQLEQVLMNLATNARDAMPKGGAFTVITQLVNLNEDFMSAHGYGNRGPYAMITVSDTGAGMDEETRRRIFEPFFTTKEVGKGTGLGLAVVYGIIKLHNGFINVYSEHGRGTSIRIYLPVIESEVTEEAEVQQQGAPARGTETVLLAEDDDSLRKLSRSVLKQFGYTVIEAVDGEDAVKKFIENKDTIQLLLFDLIMPKKNGKEAYDEIRKIKPDMKIIFASGYAPDLVRQKASLDDNAHLIYKPVSPFELLRKVRSVLDK